MAFIDYKKAFDSADITAVLEAFKDQGIEQDSLRTSTRDVWGGRRVKIPRSEME